MRRIWPKITKIYWDPDYDIPIIKPREEQIDLFYVIKLTEPGDARPGFPHDYKRLEESIKQEFHSNKLFNEWFRDKFILLNKVPHWDQMWEVISSGNVWGQLYYDPFRDTWRFRLTYSGAYYAVENGIVDYIIYNGKLRRNTVLDKKVSGQTVIVNSDMEILGLAEEIDGKTIVTKVFRNGKPPIETSMKSSDLETVLKHNEESIERYRRRAVGFLKKIHHRNPGFPVVVSYSGGKDSLVALHLTLEAIGDAILLFNDTGLELPDTIDNVEYVSKYFGLKLVIARAGNVFWDSVQRFGPPGKDYRWCCKIAKLVPIARTTRRYWGSGALNIVGQRAYESIDRAKSPQVWRNKWVPHLLSTTPIQDWNQLILWLYIYKYRLPYNPLYDRGFERLGCYLCPSSTLAEFKEVEKSYPCMWRKWLEVLEYWREKLGQPEEWATLGLWRWATPSVAKYRLARHIEGYTVNWREEYINRLLYSTAGLAPLKIIEENDSLKIMFNKKIVDRDEVNIFKANVLMLNYRFELLENNIVIQTEGTTIHIKDNVLEITPYINVDNLEDLVDILKIIYRLKNCSKCGSCILWCPLKTIKLTENGPYPVNRCDGCRICLEVCPVSEVLVEKIVVPIIINDPHAWSRPSRRRASIEENNIT